MKSVALALIAAALLPATAQTPTVAVYDQIAARMKADTLPVTSASAFRV